MWNKFLRYLIFSIVLIYPSNTCAYEHYDVIDLGGVNYFEERFGDFSLNNHSEVVIAESYAMNASYWKEGALTNLPPLVTLQFEDSPNPPPDLKDWTAFGGARDINDYGLIVGDSQSDLLLSIDDQNQKVIGGDTMTMWQDFKPGNLGYLGGIHSRANAINNKNQVVGFSYLYDPDIPRATFWENGKLVELNASENARSTAHAINESSQILGAIESGSGGSRAVLWQDDEMFDLGINLGFLNEAANGMMDINNHGEAVVSSGGDSFFWDGDLSTKIEPINYNFEGLLSLDSYAINDDSQIVGQARENTGNVRCPPFNIPEHIEYAFLLKNGSLVDLNNRIPEDSGWILQGAYDINEQGEIVGLGLLNDQLHGFLLSPVVVPEPVSYILAVLGVSVMFVRRRFFTA